MSGRRFFLNNRKMNLTWCLLLSACLCAAQSQPQTQKSQDEVIKLKAQLVSIDVMVKDKKGKYITDLKAEDFKIFENGAEQRVDFFDPPLAGGNETTAQPDGAAKEKSLTSGGRTMNILSLVLDGQTTELTNLKQVREGMLRYIRERITDTDLVAVFGVSNDLKLLQPFTQDKAKLISAVESAHWVTTWNKNLETSQLAGDIQRKKEELNNLGDVNLPQSPAAAAQGSSAAQALIALRVLEQFTRLRSQLSVQQSRPVLAALAAICQALRAIPGKKTLVMFSQGFVTPSILDWQVQSTIDIANRANVAIYIIDSAGLAGGGTQSGSFVPPSPLESVSGLNSTESRMRTVGGENVFDNVRHEGLNRQQDILYRISGDTGGEFLKGNNDIAKGLNRIDQEVRARYTLSYYSTDPNFDGGFRKLKIEVRRPDSRVISRAGYFAVASDDVVPLSPEDKKLLASVAAAEANPSLPLFVELTPFRSQGGRYVVPLSIEVPPGAMKFDRKGDRQLMQIDVLGVIRETEDKILSRLGGSFNVGLTAEQYQAILNNNIFYRQDLELAPGAYSIDLIVRDKLSGKMAARREKLVLPVADAEFSTTRAVLSRHAEPIRNQSGSVDVFSQGGAQIRPSLNREFRSTDNLIIFFDLYNAATNAEMAKPLVRVTVTVMKDGKAALRPIDYMLTEPVTEPVPHLTFAKYISLAKLPPGKYTALIEAKDMVTRKLVTQQASFVITQ